MYTELGIRGIPSAILDSEYESLTELGLFGISAYTVDEQTGIQQLIVLAIAGGITPTGAVANVLNANSVDLAGSIVPVGTLPLFLVGNDSGEGSITPSGGLSLAIIGYNIVLSADGDDNVNGITPVGALNLIVALQSSLAGGITPTGNVILGDFFQLTAGGITPSGSLLGNGGLTVITGSGFRNRLLPMLKAHLQH